MENNFVPTNEILKEVAGQIMSIAAESPVKANAVMGLLGPENYVYVKEWSETKLA